MRPRPDSPEYVKCIRDASGKRTLCGRQIDTFEWVFEGAAHAKRNEANGGRLVACPECVAATPQATP